MPIASDNQQILLNNAADQIANMSNMAVGMEAFANQLINVVKIALPTFAPGSVLYPGSVAVGNAPQFTGSYTDPGAVGYAADYQAEFEAAYSALDASVKTEVDQGVTAFMQTYAAPYLLEVTQLRDALTGAVNDQAITPSIRQTWLTEAESGLAEDRRRAYDQAANTRAFGYEVPQPGMVAAFNRINRDYYDRLGQARTGIVVKAFEMTLNYKQAALQVLDSAISGMRQSFLQYAGIHAGTMLSHALSKAKATADTGIATRETEIKGFEDRRAAALTLFKALYDQWAAKLESYKTQLMLAVDARRNDLSNMEIQLKMAEIPYRAQLERNMEQARLDIQGLMAVLASLEKVFAGYAMVAQASESGINSIGVANYSDS